MKTFKKSFTLLLILTFLLFIFSSCSFIESFFGFIFGTSNTTNDQPTDTISNLNLTTNFNLSWTDKYYSNQTVGTNTSFKYAFIDDPDVHYEGIATDIITDDTNFYVSGYYINYQNNTYIPFIYKIDSNTLNVIAKRIFDEHPYNDVDGDGKPDTIDPILAGYSKNYNFIYVVYSNDSTEEYFFYRLNASDLSTDDEVIYSQANMINKLKFNRLFVYDSPTDNCPVLVITGGILVYANGYDQYDILIFRINNTIPNGWSKISFWNFDHSNDPAYGDEMGYGVSVIYDSIAYDYYIYISGRYIDSSTETGIIIKKKFDELTSSNPQSITPTFNTNCNIIQTDGTLYSLINKNDSSILITGYYDYTINLDGSNGPDMSTILRDIDLTSLTQNFSTDYNFTPPPGTNVSDEGGIGIVYNSLSGYVGIAGWQERSDDFSDPANAAIMIKEATSSNIYLEYALLQSTEAYSSMLNSITTINSSTFMSAGYAMLGDGTNFVPLLIILTVNTGD